MPFTLKEEVKETGTSNTSGQLPRYAGEMKLELQQILDYWMQFTIDHERGGFHGRLDHSNHVDITAARGGVLNSRILWAFSAAYNLTHNEQYLVPAQRAYDYLVKHFIDKKYGGIYWSVDHAGWPLDTKKQVYALSFAAYALSEFYMATQNDDAKNFAIGQYRSIVEHSYDTKYGGYTEAFTRNWQELSDLRLSEKDANEKKSMNTHLHLLEAFTNLYRIWPDEGLKQRVIELIYIFINHIIDPQTGHLKLFFDDKWNHRSSIISYGHDIEAAWLIQEAAEVISNELLLMKIKSQSLQLAKAASRGLDSDGGLWYEYDTKTHHLIKQKHSWPQAEAMVGFLHAWQITGDESWLLHSLQSWEFVKKHIRDVQRGEWFWGISGERPMLHEDKVGIWKCPYHNSRACIEVIRRINQ